MLHIQKINPMFTALVTTGERFQKDDYHNGVIVSKKGDLKVYQKVLEVGPMVNNIKPGDMVMINIEHFAVKKFDANSLQNDMDNNPTLKYIFNWVTIYDKEDQPKDCLLLDNRDILYSFEGKEVDEPQVILEKPSLIL